MNEFPFTIENYNCIMINLLINIELEMRNTQEFCREFRRNTLKMTLKDVEHNTGTNIKTVWAFENGKSSNINHLRVYMKLCNTLNQRQLFIKGLSKAVLLDGGVNNDLCSSNNEQ